MLLAASAQWLLPTSAFAQTTKTIVVSGLGGNAEYDEQFIEFSNTIANHARDLAEQEQDVILLQGKQATKQAILDAISQLQKLDVEDSARVFLLGHGSFDGSDYKYNIPGPDLTGNEITDALNQLPASQQLLVLAFQYAERAVAKHYENEKLLASEHARLNGDTPA